MHVTLLILLSSIENRDKKLSWYTNLYRDLGTMVHGLLCKHSHSFVPSFNVIEVCL